MMFISEKKLSFSKMFALILALLFLQILILKTMGLHFICACGYVKLWQNKILSPEMSQHLFDAYSFTHVLHGILFYLLLTLVFKRLHFSKKILLACTLEIGWEILENSPWLIHAYRQQALAQGYNGDSIINSVSDVCCMMLGFTLASYLPKKTTLLLFILVEISLAYFIRDNLTLNILNFIHPFSFIHQWQAALH